MHPIPVGWKCGPGSPGWEPDWGWSGLGWWPVCDGNTFCRLPGRRATNKEPWRSNNESPQATWKASSTLPCNTHLAFVSYIWLYLRTHSFMSVYKGIHIYILYKSFKLPPPPHFWSVINNTHVKLLFLKNQIKENSFKLNVHVKTQWSNSSDKKVYWIVLQVIRKLFQCTS